MSALYLAVPLPPFHRWRLLADASDCPDAHVIIATLASGRTTTAVARSGHPGSSEVAELLRLYGRLDASRRRRLIEHALELANASPTNESAGDVS